LQEKRHYYNSDHAVKYGDREAIFIQNLRYWILYNKSNKKNHYKNRTWMYNTLTGLCQIFPFWTRNQLWTVINSLRAQKIIITDNFNHTKFDRTLWYAFTNESLFLNEENDMEKTNTDILKTKLPYLENQKSNNKTITKPITKLSNKNYLSKSENGFVSNNSLFEGNLNEYELPKSILHIIFSMNELGNFNLRFPINGKPPTKVFQRIVSHLKGIKDGTFARGLDLDKEWVQKFHIDTWPNAQGYNTWGKVRELLFQSLDNFIEDNKDSGNKISLEAFFYFEPFGQRGKGKSMFLKYLNNSPKTLI
jgi:hypothetical protein